MIHEFAPEGDKEHDAIEVVREWDDLRPIGKKLNSSKFSCCAINGALRRPLYDSVHECQRGFIAGRHFCRNNISLDTWSRTVAIVCHHRNPICATFVYAAAFASVLRSWILFA